MFGEGTVTFSPKQCREHPSVCCPLNDKATGHDRIAFFRAPRRTSLQASQIAPPTGVATLRRVEAARRHAFFPARRPAERAATAIVAAFPRASRPDRPYIRTRIACRLRRGGVMASHHRIPKDDLMSGSEFFAQHFGLTERPFTLLPDPDFLYWTPAHKRAFSVLEYGVMTRAPITVITGEVGAGKTTLLQKLLTVFEPDTTVGLISNATGNRGELLQWVLNALDVPCDLEAAYVTKFQTLQNFVIDQYSQNRHVVLIIDEAQNLSVEGLEELRMLTNINANKDELLQLILMGQPELREMITRYELRQFAQRVTASFHIPDMDLESTRGYIRHRLQHAGGSGEEFTDDAIERIHWEANGIPRLVNKLADFAMVYAVTSEKVVVDADVVDEVLADNIFLEIRDYAEEAAE
jgi:general secretion pathway protein A